jgi:hypothetical protein
VISMISTTNSCESCEQRVRVGVRELESGAGGADDGVADIMRWRSARWQPDGHLRRNQTLRDRHARPMSVAPVLPVGRGGKPGPELLERLDPSLADAQGTLGLVDNSVFGETWGGSRTRAMCSLRMDQFTHRRHGSCQSRRSLLRRSGPLMPSLLAHVVLSGRSVSTSRDSSPGAPLS